MPLATSKDLQDDLQIIEQQIEQAQAKILMARGVQDYIRHLESCLPDAAAAALLRELVSEGLAKREYPQLRTLAKRVKLEGYHRMKKELLRQALVVHLTGKSQKGQ